MMFGGTPSLGAEDWADLVRWLRVDAVGSVTELQAAGEQVSRRVVGGSLAKLEAMAAGQVPPTAELGRIEGRVVSGEATSWSCHAQAALLVGLVNGFGEMSAGVAIAQRRGTGAAPVDLHSLVVVRHQGAAWVMDPHFAVPPLPLAWGGAAWRHTRTAWSVESGQEWGVGLRCAEVPWRFWYQKIAENVDGQFMDAVGRISTTHSGVRLVRGAWVYTERGVLRVTETERGQAELVEAEEETPGQLVVRTHLFDSFRDGYECLVHSSAAGVDLAGLGTL